MPSDKPKPSTAKKSKTRASAKAKVTKRSARKPSKKKKARFIKRTTIIPVLIVSLVLFLSYLFYLDQRITERFEGRIWQLPAHVYARPLELYVR